MDWCDVELSMALAAKIPIWRNFQRHMQQLQELHGRERAEKILAVIYGEKRA